MNRLPYLPGKMIESHHNWKSSDKLNISGQFKLLLLELFSFKCN